NGPKLTHPPVARGGTQPTRLTRRWDLRGNGPKLTHSPGARGGTQPTRLTRRWDLRGNGPKLTRSPGARGGSGQTRSTRCWDDGERGMQRHDGISMGRPSSQGGWGRSPKGKPPAVEPRLARRGHTGPSPARSQPSWDNAKTRGC